MLVPLSQLWFGRDLSALARTHDDEDDGTAQFTRSGIQARRTCVSCARHPVTQRPREPERLGAACTARLFPARRITAPHAQWPRPLQSALDGT
jgi:hypothetical protein